MVDHLHSLRPGCEPAELSAFVNTYMAFVLAAEPPDDIAVSVHLDRLKMTLSACGYPNQPAHSLRKRFADHVGRHAAGSVDVGHPVPGPSLLDQDWGPVGSPPPIPLDLVTPPGWSVGPRGVTRHGGSATGGATPTYGGEVCPSPVFVTARLIDEEDGLESVQLTWPRDGVWKTHVVARGVAASKVKLIDLADVGLPVNSETSGKLVSYLADFEAANLTLLPRLAVSHALGWTAGHRAFLWGATLLQGGRDAAAPTAVQFRGADGGDDQLARGFRAGGSFESWREAVTPFLTLPKVRLAVTAGLAAPLLTPLGAPNAIVEFCGDTSGGKTVALRTAASSWGNPDERAADAAMGTWDLTRVAAERMLRVVNNMPLVLDDTRRASDPELMSRVVYDVVAGRGRGRGTLKGLRRTGTWSTVLVSSGEGSVNDLAEKGGAKARVLSLWGTPFGTVDDATGMRVKGLNHGVLANYGHAGPMLVRFVLDRRHEWDGWRRRYQQTVTEYGTRAGNNGVLSRMADTFAVLDFTAALAAAALDMPALAASPVTALWDELTGEVGQADVPRRALRAAYEWAIANSEKFFPSESGGNPNHSQPPRGWAGKWERATPQWEYIAFFDHTLTDLLKSVSFDAPSTIRSWKQRGWVQLGADGYHRSHRMGSSTARLVTVTRAALDALDAHLPPQQAQRERPRLSLRDGGPRGSPGCGAVTA